MATETATTVPPKGLGAIQGKDFIKGLYYASVGQLIVMLYFLVSNILQPHPHWPTWAEWLPSLQAFVQTVLGYFFGKAGVNNVGQIFQRDKPVVHVDEKDLKKLEQKAAQADAQ